jgi:hypothetical protein
MIWATYRRCAALALFVMAVAYAVTAWAVPCAPAFTMENLSTGGNTTRFAEPDGPANNFGRGAQPFGPGGPMVQFGARQGQLTPFSRSPGSGYNSTPPEPYASGTMCEYCAAALHAAAGKSGVAPRRQVPRCSARDRNQRLSGRIGNQVQMKMASRPLGNGD